MEETKGSEPVKHMSMCVILSTRVTCIVLNGATRMLKVMHVLMCFAGSGTKGATKKEWVGQKGQEKTSRHTAARA